MIVLMGSGETSPTMVELHKERVAATRGLGPLIVLDTPYGFQTNADELGERICAYFRDSVSATAQVAGLRSSEVPLSAQAAVLDLVRSAGYVFAGPGSPSYAVRHWRATGLAARLLGCLERGGTLGFASAASLALGRWTLPVYEIYKVGEPPHWIDGLDVLSGAGLPVGAVIPHFDNTEGGTHDTSCCYVGRARLERLRAELPPGAAVLGVDEHTALSIDPATKTGRVSGQGSAHVLIGDREDTYGAGETLDLSSLPPLGEWLTTAVESAPVDEGDPWKGLAPAAAGRRAEELIEHLVAAAERHAPEAVRADAAEALVAVRPVLDAGWVPPEETVRPFVEALLRARAVARETKAYAVADAVRDDLRAAGVEVSDTAEGTAWKWTG